jgi:ribosomal protein S18 acetylase RimI-like enzyme
MALGWSSGTRRAKGLHTVLQLFPFVLPRLLSPFLFELFRMKIPQNAYYLSNIAIFPPHRGKGLGSFLLQVVEKEAQNSGDSWLVLDVERENVRALTFYLRNGYEVLRGFPSFVRLRKGWGNPHSSFRE